MSAFESMSEGTFADLFGALSTLEVRVALVLAAGLAIAASAGARSAARRTRLLAASAVLALLVPAVAVLGPRAVLRLDLGASRDARPAALAPAVATVGDPSTPRRLAGASDATDPMPAREGLLSTVPAVLLGAWLLGSTVLLVRLARAWSASRRLLRGASALPAGLARRAAARGLAVPVRLHPDLPAPVTAGLRRPVVLLPPASTTWDDDALAAVLEHEAEHARRRDGMLQLPCDLLVALHWWNPLAWATRAALRRARERAADDAAIRAGVKPTGLARQILEGACALRRDALVLRLGEGRDLAARIERLLAPGFSPGDAGAGPVLAAGLLALAGVALVVAPARESPVPMPMPATASEPTAAATTVLDFATSPLVLTVQPDSDGEPRLLVEGAPPQASEPSDTEGHVYVDVVRSEGGLHATITDDIARANRAAHAAMDALAARSPARATVIVMDVPGDRLLVRLDHGASGPSGPLSVGRESLGSVVKPLTAALALEAKVVTTSDVLDCGTGPVAFGDGTIRDVEPIGRCTLADVIARSSNVGTARVGERLGASALREGFVRLGVGASLPDGAWSAHEQALAAGGPGLRTTPVEMARAYALVARSARGEAAVLDASAARQVLDLMVHAVEKGTGSKARMEGHRIAGKTGTATRAPDGTIATFVGVIPAGAPRWVVLVAAETHEPGYTGGSVAAPAFRAAAEVLLDG